jgi:hypothetical protein
MLATAEDQLDWLLQRQIPTAWGVMSGGACQARGVRLEEFHRAAMTLRHRLAMRCRSAPLVVGKW